MLLTHDRKDTLLLFGLFFIKKKETQQTKKRLKTGSIAEIHNRSVMRCTMDGVLWFELILVESSFLSHRMAMHRETLHA